MKQKKQKKSVFSPSAPALIAPRAAIPEFIVASLLVIWAYFVVKAYFKSINFNPLAVNALDILFAAKYYPHSKNPAFFLTHLLHILINMLVVLAAYGFGKKLWNILKFNDTGDIGTMEEPLFQTALGYGVIIFTTLFAGLAGFLYASLIWFIIISGLVFALPELKSLWGIIKAGRQKQSDGGYLIPWIVIIFTFGINLLGALVPETFYDSLVYNIGLSQNWINHKKIFSDNNMLVSFYPLNFTVLYTAGILLKNEIVAKLMALTFITGTFVSIYVFCRKYFSASVAIIAGLLFYTVPIVMNIAWKTSIEPGMSFYEFLTLFAIVNWFNDKKVKWFYLGAIFSGIALGGKYTSFISLTSVTSLIFIKTLVSDKESLISAVKKTFIFGAIAFLVASVWYIKNFITAGDPFYPLFWKFNNQMNNNDPAHVALTLSNILLFPWKYTMGILQQETLLGPLFLLIIPLLLLFKTLNRNIKFITVYFSIFFVLWFFIGKAYLRFFAPGLAVLSIISACYVMALPSKYGFKKLMVLFISVLSLANVLFAAIILKSNMDPWGYFLGMESRSEYLSKQRPSYPNAYYNAADWINKNTETTAKVLILGDCRGFYINRRFLCHMASELNPLVHYVKSSSNDDVLYEKLKADGITHLLLNVPEASRLSQYDFFKWEKRDMPVLGNFWSKHVRLKYSYCGDVTLSNGIPGSMIPDFWNKYSQNPFNLVYVYEILPANDKLASEQPYNFMLDQRLYSENQKKILNSSENSSLNKTIR